DRVSDQSQLPRPQRPGKGVPREPARRRGERDRGAHRLAGGDLMRGGNRAMFRTRELSVELSEVVETLDTLSRHRQGYPWIGTKRIKKLTLPRPTSGSRACISKSRCSRKSRRRPRVSIGRSRGWSSARGSSPVWKSRSYRA